MKRVILLTLLCCFSIIGYAQILDPELSFSHRKRKTNHISVELPYEVKPYSSANMTFGLFNYKGKKILDPEYVFIGAPSCGLIRIRHKNGKYGYINDKGYFRIGVQYSDAGDFKNGYAIVYNDRNHLIIDSMGRVTDTISHLPYQFDKGYVGHGMDGRLRLIFVQCDSVSPSHVFKVQNIREGVYRLSGNHKYSTKEFYADYVSDFAYGYAVYKKDDRWGYIGSDGKVAFPAYYDMAFPFQDSLAWVVKGDEFILLDKDFNMILVVTKDCFDGNKDILVKLENAYKVGGEKWKEMLLFYGLSDYNNTLPFVFQQRKFWNGGERSEVVEYVSKAYEPHNLDSASASLIVSRSYTKYDGEYRAVYHPKNSYADVSQMKFYDFAMCKNGKFHKPYCLFLDPVISKKEYKEKVWERLKCKEASFYLSGDFFFVGSNDTAWAVFDESGKMSSGFEYDELKYYNRNIYLAIKQDARIDTLYKEQPHLKRSFQRLMSDFEYVDVDQFVTIKQRMKHPISDADQGKKFRTEPQTSDGYLNPFFIQKHEVTNGMYKEFVEYVRDSIVHVMLGEAGNPDELGYHYLCGPDEMELSESVDKNRIIDWSQKIDWKNEEVQYILDDPNYGIYIPENERFYHEKKIDTRKLTYHYVEDEIDYYVDVYPDTSLFDQLFEGTSLNTLTNSYFSSDYFDDYPVVGISQRQAYAFCYWYQKRIREIYGSQIANLIDAIRLPSELELESIASSQACSLGFGNERNTSYIKTPNHTFYPVEKHRTSGVQYLSRSVNEWTSTTVLYDNYDLFNQSYLQIISQNPWMQLYSTSDWVQLSKFTFFDKLEVTNYWGNPIESELCVVMGALGQINPCREDSRLQNVMKTTDQSAFVGFRLVIIPYPKAIELLRESSERNFLLPSKPLYEPLK